MDLTIWLKPNLGLNHLHLTKENFKRVSHRKIKKNKFFCDNFCTLVTKLPFSVSKINVNDPIAGRLWIVYETLARPNDFCLDATIF